MKKKLLLFAALTISLTYSYAQPGWQWAKRGGSSTAWSGSDEIVVDMATDRNGNFYVLGNTFSPGLNVDGHPLPTWGTTGSQAAVLTSFKCDGTYRWSKVLGAAAGTIGLATDQSDGVYVTGALAMTSNVHVDLDTGWYLPAHQRWYVAKFDTAGNYKWIRMPEADTSGLTTIQNTLPWGIDVDQAGNLHLLASLPPSSYAGGAYVVTSQGVHILNYDRYGNFIGGHPMDISVTGTSPVMLYMKIDKHNGRYYITGGQDMLKRDTLRFGTTIIDGPQFIGAFNSTGGLIWERHSTPSALWSSYFYRADLDAQHNIYMAGTSNYTTTVDTFNGYIVPTGQATPFVVKMDSNGHNIWAASATNNAASVGYGVTVAGNEAVISGSYPGKLKWAGYADSLNHGFNTGYDRFIVRFDATTGAVIKMDSIASPILEDEFGPGPPITGFGSTITSDKFGNVYIGGYFAAEMDVPGDTITIIGGDNDYFIAQYGTGNCTNPITLEARSEPVVAGNPLHIYPNPATDELFIEGGAPGTAIRLYNLMGQTPYSGFMVASNEKISIKNLAPGVYILETTGPDGIRNISRVVKK